MVTVNKVVRTSNNRTCTVQAPGNGPGSGTADAHTWLKEPSKLDTLLGPFYNTFADEHNEKARLVVRE